MGHPGDDGRSAWNRGPEILAAEQRILTYSDALLSWMRHEADLGPEYAEEVVTFLAHLQARNPGGTPVHLGAERLILEKMDPDANRLFLDLLRSAWELRCWRTHYGEITPQERDR